MKRNQLLRTLKSLGITQAISDKNAIADGSPAILLRWNGREEYYTGFGADPMDYQPEYEAWLKRTFGDDNSTNTKARSLEIYAAAVDLVGPIDASEAVEIRPLAHKLAKQVNCHYDTAKRHIVKAIRRKRGELVKLHQDWGGSRKGAGYPKGEPRKTE